MRSRTAPAVNPAATQPLPIVCPRFRNSTDNMLGSAKPIKQAGIQIPIWSRTTWRYQRFQRGNADSVGRNTVPTCDNWMFCPPKTLGMDPTCHPIPHPWSRV